MATILVVDDVPPNRQFLGTLLGYSQFPKMVQAVAPFWCTIVRLPLD
jgi:CheY-like chemotaxis protein